MQDCQSSTATRLRPAQGCRFGYPGNREHKMFNRNAVAPFDEGRTDATALRLENNWPFIPNVAEAATLGWRAQPLCG